MCGVTQMSYLIRYKLHKEIYTDINSPKSLFFERFQMIVDLFQQSLQD